MLAPDEELAIATQFGVAKQQVRRDHLISHLLAALSEHIADQLIFFGGTALSRTFAPAGRLSEDIDLIARLNRSATAAAVERALVRATRREYPGLQWQPRLTAVRGTAPGILTAALLGRSTSAAHRPDRRFLRGLEDVDVDRPRGLP